MTNPNYAHILMIVDRSGSMGGTKQEAAEAGIADFIKEQQGMAKANDMSVTLSLAQFDDEFEWVFNRQFIARLGVVVDGGFRYPLIPRGMTALLDAIGKGVVADGERLALLPEDERPDKVVCVIMTDGMNNASKDWTKDGVRELISRQKNQFNWQFVFLSADLDSFTLAGDIGTQSNMKMADTGAGMTRSYGITGQSVSAYLSDSGAETVVLPQELSTD